MTVIHNEAAATRPGFARSVVAAALVLAVIMVAIFTYAGPATDPVWLVGP
jgi:hypothetical protein